MGDPDAFEDLPANEDLAANLPPAWQAWPAGRFPIVITQPTKKT